MRGRRVTKKILSFGIVLVLVAVVFAVMPVPVSADGGADPSSTWIVEPGFRLDGGWPHCPDIVELPDGTYNYRMYHTDASPYSDSYPTIIKSAVSSDGLTWTKENGIRIGLGFGGQETWTNTPDTIILSDGTYRMYYSHERYPFVGPLWGHILSAVSNDGVTWTKEAGIRVDYGGTYDPILTMSPNIIELPDGTYRMYYSGRDGDTNHRILSAISSDGLTWIKEPGIRIDIGGIYDSYRADQPKVIQVPDGRYIMFYAGFDELWSGQILSAISWDGLTWTKESGIRISPEGLEGGPYSYVSVGDIIKLSDGQYRMYFSADRHPKTGVTPDQWKNRFRILSAVGTIPLISPRDLKEDVITELEAAKDHLTICPEGMVGYWKFDEIFMGGAEEEVSYEAHTSYSYPPQWIDATPINKINLIKIEWWIRSHSTDPNYQAYFWAAEVSDSSGVIYSNTNQLTSRDTINYVLAAKYEPGGTFDVTEVKSKWYGNNWHTMDAKVIVYYLIPNVVVDSSGNGNNGTIHGASWTPGQVNGALEFDGVDDYVEVPDSTTLDIGTSDFSISLWYKADTVPKKNGNGVVLIGKRDSFIKSSAGYTFGFLEEGLGALASLGDGSGSKLRIEGSTFNTADNIFHHMVLNCDRNGFAQINVDSSPSGEPMDISSHSSSIANGLNLLIGAVYNSGHGGDYLHFNGIIDEVAIWDRVLTPEEIKQYYINGLAGKGYCEKIEPQPKINKKIDCIIKSIEKSLNDKYWLDETHLDPKHGGKVFFYELLAVVKMKLISKCTDLSFDSSIEKLIKGDELLAETAIDDAEDMEVKCDKYQKKVDCWIKKAKGQMTKAEEDREDGKCCKTITHYLLAWKYAQKAIKFANKECKGCHGDHQ